MGVPPAFIKRKKDQKEGEQAYRRLMRQYHPDKFPDDPARRQLATSLSQKLTRAYNELSRLLRDAEKSSS